MPVLLLVGLLSLIVALLVSSELPLGVSVAETRSSNSDFALGLNRGVDHSTPQGNQL